MKRRDIQTGQPMTVGGEVTVAVHSPEDAFTPRPSVDVLVFHKLRCISWR